MKLYTAPEPLPKDDPPEFSIFLAGSIEMGKAVDWQKEMIKRFEGRNVVIFNPRRSDWDSSWKQEAINPQFNEQVTWELDAQDMADQIIMYLAPGTVSPISLLELGLYSDKTNKFDTGKLIVICPFGFERKGNVEIVCARLKIPLFHNLSSFYDTMNL